jgi:putative transposase
MSRLPRYAAPGQPHHVIQRGNNRTALFTVSEDYQIFSEYLLAAMFRHECLIHAYVFMTNHVHLLITPAVAGGIGKLMGSVGRRYVRYFNGRHGRTGTLWEGRYRATLIDSERYLLTCYRYIELNPVRAGLASHPGEYRWSSHAANAFGTPDPLVSPHARYLELAGNPSARRAAYQALFLSAIDRATLDAIRSATNKQWALGSEAFRRRAAARLNRRASPLRRGRPRAGVPKRDGEIRL